MLEMHAKEDVTRIRIAARHQLNAAILTAVAMNDGAEGADMYEQMSAKLGETDTSDDAHLSDPNAQTDVAMLEQFLERKHHERTDSLNGRTENGSGGGSGGGSR